MVVACGEDEPGAMPPRRDIAMGVMAKWHKTTYLPVRSISNIFGKMVYTMKSSTGMDTIKSSVKRLSG